MKKWILGLVAAALVSMPASAELPDHNKVRQLGNQLAPGGQAGQIGSWIVDHKVHITKASWSVLKDGTANKGDAVLLRGVDNKPAIIPAGAIIKGVIVDTLIPLAGTSSPRIGLRANNIGDTTFNTLMLTYQAADWGTTANTLKTGFVSSVLPIKLTAKKAVSLFVEGGAVNTGKFNVFVEYYLSDVP